MVIVKTESEPCVISEIINDLKCIDDTNRYHHDGSDIWEAYLTWLKMTIAIRKKIIRGEKEYD